MPHPFRFGVQISTLPPDTWQADVRRIEEMGYSTVFLPDHFGTQWDPTTALAGIAAATESLNLGSLVFDVDYRHPVIHAKAAATLHLMSGGRHEFGIGAGWMETDYVEAGMAYDRPGIRISRLKEALEIITSMWENERTSFKGEHYETREIAQAAELGDRGRPKILIGGGGQRLLRLAGRYADIVGINPKLVEGKVTAETPADSAPERIREKVGWIREGALEAGRNPDEIELNSLTFVTAILDDVTGLRGALAKSSGMTVEQIADCPLFLTGSAQEIRERLEQRREETGISYIVIQGGDEEVLENFAKEIVQPLAG
ncbi:MAG: TIGR03621 family F420-dependent LLM class oxidoreductase [Deltaproteobacteria bacterium]|nr:TIGR03621 family F420-dependent LLM class oxidoreductase [Deltaproteobacteria bacterium]